MPPDTETPTDLPRAEAIAWNAIETFGPHSAEAVAACEVSAALRARADQLDSAGG